VSDKSAIEWTDATWNPIRGCSRVSEGCRNCYAERVAARFSGPGLPYEGLAVMRNGEPRWSGEVRVIEKHLLDPIRWKTPRRIFVNSMSDLFHEHLFDDDIARVFAVMALAPQHTFQILTKRPERMRDLLSHEGMDRRVAGAADRFAYRGSHKNWSVRGGVWIPAWPLPNVWLGVSAEHQAAADERIPLLLQTPAAVRFVSAEPLLGPIDFAGWMWMKTFLAADGSGRIPTNELDWVICGGESGPGARPMHPEWPLSIRDQCQAAGVAYFFKQWGEYAPPGITRVGGLGPVEELREMHRVGKKAAGRLLDGRTWDEFPMGAA